MLGGAALGWPRVLRAQQKRVPVIGLLGAGSRDRLATQVAAFHQGLGDTGYVEGQNLAIEYRWAEGVFDRLPAMAADLVARKVDVIVATAPPAVVAAKAATSTIPIVFNTGDDPVATGLVASLARPGGNLTGVSILLTELVPKRLELLSEMVPQARVIALLVNPNGPEASPTIAEAEKAARTKGVEIAILRTSTGDEITTAFATLAQLHADALLVGNDPLFNARLDQLQTLAAHHRVPAIYFFREFTAAGGLISYGPNLALVYRQAGIYAGKILNGAKPADLPVQQPTKFELVINLKTAQALGLTVPQSMLMRADEVIE
jgi:putative ABC transport system substrate-binding protein